MSSIKYKTPSLSTLVSRSTSVSGIVKEQRRMSEMARLAIKMLRVVSMSLLVKKATSMAILPTIPSIMTALYRTIRELWTRGSSLRVINSNFRKTIKLHY